MFKLKIKEYRIARNMTQEELAKASNVSQQLISELEKLPEHRKKSPTIFTLYKISTALDVCVFELLQCPTCESCDKRKICKDRSCLHLESSSRDFGK